MKRNQIKEILERGDKTEILTLFSIVDGMNILYLRSFRYGQEFFSLGCLK